MKGNWIANILLGAGVLFIVIGTFHAYAMSQIPYGVGMQGSNIDQETDWRQFFFMMSDRFINGMLLIGMAEIIRVLYRIKHKKVEVVMPAGTGTLPQQQVSQPNEEPAQQASEWKLEEKDVWKIYELYAGSAILELLPSQMYGYCVVKLQTDEGTKVKVANVQAASAEEVDDPEIRNKIISWYNERT
ncbi:hypothetical protein [Lentibacillus sediminis]|uniref:hypothetical protein n=1 Tax=Lentibacillus sediminis TaxID=1940529 RepID=UPI000C1C1880|nr:hypothetical protein [Lentibacillus sediminis]